MKVRWLICAVAILCCASAAFADGTVFVQGMAKPRIPDQSALIVFDGKTERLVIETAVEGKGSEFAWIVPVPSIPKVEAATPGLFPTLRMITRPRVVGYGTDRLVLPALGLLFGIMIWAAVYIRGWIIWLAIFLPVLILSIILLPTLAGAKEGVGSMPMMSNGVSVLERKIVGVYETATISGADGKKITEWLNSNGFNVAAGMQDALTQYAREGWIFVAARIRRDSAEAGRFNPHPLSFSFATSRAVYPLRLTGIENGPLTVDLYVVGNDEAAAGSFVRQRAGRLEFNSQEERDDFVPLSHEALQSYCKGFSALTLLSATLSPEQMSADLYLTWKPPTPFRHVYYMREAAQALASQFGAGAFVLLSIVCAVRYRRRYQGGPAAWERFLAAAGVLLSFLGAMVGLVLAFAGVFIGVLILVGFAPLLIVSGRRAADYDRQIRQLQPSNPAPPLRAPILVVLAPILLGSCVYLALPKISGADLLRVSGFSRYNDLGNHRNIVEEVSKIEPAGEPEAVLAAYRKEAASIIAEWASGEQAKYYNNPFTGRPFREEDSPGNYVIELKDGKPAYFYFDDAGKKIELGVIGPETKKYE